MRKLILAFLVLVYALPGHAAGTCQAPQVEREQVFFVSVILKEIVTEAEATQRGKSAVMKLAHAVVPAATESDALVTFFNSARRQYPGFEISAVFASEEPITACARTGGILAL